MQLTFKESKCEPPTLIMFRVVPRIVETRLKWDVLFGLVLTHLLICLLWRPLADNTIIKRLTEMFYNAGVPMYFQVMSMQTL